VIWFITDPSRSRQEREAIEALVAASDWLIPGEWRIDSSMRLIWDADIAVGDRTRPVSLQYPNHFPHSPPVVLPRGDTTRWSSHQYGAGGELCLEYGPDNWHPDITGATMIESAHRLLSGENPTGEQPGSVASRHATTLGQDLAYKSRRLALTAELKSFVSQLPPNTAGKGTITLRFCDGSVLYTIDSINTAGGEKWRDTSVPQAVAEEGYNKDVAIAPWPEDLPLPSRDSQSAFRSTFEQVGWCFPT
jgi:sulfur-carrier protein adenylyltransferase/sulfurtransferase